MARLIQTVLTTETSAAKKAKKAAAKRAAAKKPRPKAAKDKESKALKEVRKTGRKKDGTPPPAKHPRKKAATKKRLGSGMKEIESAKPASKKNAVARVAADAAKESGWDGVGRKDQKTVNSLATIVHRSDGWIAHHAGGPAAVVTKGKQVHIFHGDDAKDKAIEFVNAQGKKVKDRKGA